MRSMTETADALRTAREAVGVAKQYIEKARDADPDPEVTGVHVYPQMLGGLQLLQLWIDGRTIAGQPDLERERGQS